MDLREAAENASDTSHRTNGPADIATFRHF